MKKVEICNSTGVPVPDFCVVSIHLNKGGKPYVSWTDKKITKYISNTDEDGKWRTVKKMVDMAVEQCNNHYESQLKEHESQLKEFVKEHEINDQKTS